MSPAAATGLVIALCAAGIAWAKTANSITQALVRLVIVAVVIGLVAQSMGGL